MVDPSVMTGEHFWMGNIACAEGAISAGCRFFAGYPITPATEIAEQMARRLPQIKGVYIQMEDEIASMAAVLGASWAGRKSMTATSGPGLSLMLENIGLGIMTETPCVIVNVQRGSPSTGLPTLVGQADMMQARWGAHGDYEIIAYAPSSAQECFDLTVLAFYMSEKYRVPVFILSDGFVGYMTEKVVVPPAESIPQFNRQKPNVSREKYLPHHLADNEVPPMAVFGDGYCVHATGLTHDDRGYPDTTEQAQDILIKRLIGKIRLNIDDITRYEATYLDDAAMVVVSYGITSRVCAKAVELARSQGIAVGHLRIISVWPFPDHLFRWSFPDVKHWIVPEINMGQIVREVQRAVCGQGTVTPVSHAGGDVIRAEKILSVLKELCK